MNIPSCQQMKEMHTYFFLIHTYSFLFFYCATDVLKSLFHILSCDLHICTLYYFFAT